MNMIRAEGKFMECIQVFECPFQVFISGGVHELIDGSWNGSKFPPFKCSAGLRWEKAHFYQKRGTSYKSVIL